eukprot:3241872-Rhodomonas_salina.1
MPGTDVSHSTPACTRLLRTYRMASVCAYGRGMRCAVLRWGMRVGWRLQRGGGKRQGLKRTLVCYQPTRTLIRSTDISI